MNIFKHIVPYVINVPLCIGVWITADALRVLSYSYYLRAGTSEGHWI